VSLTVSPTVSLTVSLTVSPSPSLSPCLSLCLSHRVSHCVSHCLSHRVTHCVSHCLSHRLRHCDLPHRLSLTLQANTAIACIGRAGSGRGLPVIVVIDGQTSALYNNFSYSPPTVERFDRDRAFPGDPLVIVGASFGTVPGDIRVMIGQQECTAGASFNPHPGWHPSQSSPSLRALTNNGLGGWRRQWCCWWNTRRSAAPWASPRA
jgi:hypothetical protein